MGSKPLKGSSKMRMSGWLTELVGSVRVYPGAYSVLISREGRVMVNPVEEFNMQRTVQDYASQASDTANYRLLTESMLAGKAGNVALKHSRRERVLVFYAPIEETGWSMAIAIPDSAIFGEIRKMGLLVSLLMLVGLGMLILILRSVARNQIKLTQLNENKERMEHELQIGHNIQMSMIPKTFPPFPERKDIDMAATLVPAREVGGDLYDYYIRDEKLFFCIGDVSGKGVPAALVMAKTITQFRNVVRYEDDLKIITESINKTTCDGNETAMFVTFFVGVVDLHTGRLQSCNAGHNKPLIVNNSAADSSAWVFEELPDKPNLPLGVMEDTSYVVHEKDLPAGATLFLYTDGLTEAINAERELFGLDRVKEHLKGGKSCKVLIEEMTQAVNQFVGEAPQHDDLTLLALKIE